MYVSLDSNVSATAISASTSNQSSQSEARVGEVALPVLATPQQAPGGRLTCADCCRCMDQMGEAGMGLFIIICVVYVIAEMIEIAKK